MSATRMESMDGYVAEPAVDGRGWVLWTPDGGYVQDGDGHPVVWPSEETLYRAIEDHRRRSA